MSETVEGRLKALAQRQGHPGSLNIADVGHMMQSWKKQKNDLKRQLDEALRCGIFCKDGCVRDKKLEAIRKWGQIFAQDNEEFDAIMEG